MLGIAQICLLSKPKLRATCLGLHVFKISIYFIFKKFKVDDVSLV